MWPVVVGAPGAAAVRSTLYSESCLKIIRGTREHFYFWMRWLAVCTINSNYTRT